MNRLISALAVAFALVATGRAQTIEFVFGPAYEGQTTFPQTVSGLTLTVSNPNSSDGTFSADGSGLVLTEQPNLGPNFFEFSFDFPVQIIGYEIGAVLDPTLGDFTLATPGQSLLGNDLSQVGTFSLNGVFVAAAHEVISLNATLDSTQAGAQLRALTVLVIPEPGPSALLLGASVLGVPFLRRRRRLLRRRCSSGHPLPARI